MKNDTTDNSGQNRQRRVVDFSKNATENSVDKHRYLWYTYNQKGEEQSPEYERKKYHGIYDIITRGGTPGGC